MTDRVVKIRLDADASGAVRGFAAVRDAAAETRTRIAESARSQREDWATVGKGLTAVGVAVTGLGLAAMKTGVEYNTLQQTTRAALSTILGSAQAANAQMDKLDAFAKNSPFAKQTFITAQQQMLAFGIETQKVIPYLDALQNAVAASGGSNQDIAELAEIFGKVRASAKITSIDLQMFGRRGVNAAELIGSQMGKTGAQIRSEITAGTLDAGQALDALAKGMDQKYAGAAANVKQTFAGALDRVKAAWRDFSAEIAKPLVDPNGGGALVDLLNWTADAMRNFEKLPDPIKRTAVELTGFTGIAALLAGGFFLLTPKVLAFKDALVALGVTRTVVSGGLKDFWQFLTGPWGVALLSAAVAVRMFNSAMESSKVSSDALSAAVKQGKSALDEMKSTASANEKGLTRLFVDVSQHLDDLPALMDKAATAGRGFWSSMSFNENAALDVLAEFGSSLATLASTDLPAAQAAFKRFTTEAGLNTTQALTALNEEMPTYKQHLIDAANASDIATDDATLLAFALGEIGVSSSASAAEAGRMESGLIQMADAAKTAWGEISGLIDSLEYFNQSGQNAERQNARLQEAMASVNQYVEQARAGVDGYSLSLDAATAEGSKNRAMLADLAGQSQATAAALFEQEVSTLGAADATANYRARLQEGRDALVETARQFGMSEEAAQAFADTIYKMPSEKEFKILTNTAEAESSIQHFIDRNSGRTITVNMALGERVAGINSIGGITYAGGGTIGYAGGGTIPGYASGSTVGAGGGVRSGTVYGAGTSKSDSILVRLSKGEEVIQEPYASASRPLLKAINRGDYMQSMMRPQVVVVQPQAESPLIGGNVQFVSSGNLHDDIGTVTHELRRLGRGGKYVGSR